jgi:predicted nuclease with TOPRIM domain
MHGIAIKTLTPILSFLSSKNPKERMRDNMDLKVHIQERLPKKKKKKEEEEEEGEEEKKKLKQKHFLNQNKSNPSYNCLLF